MQFPIVLGVSARHAHLCREHMDILLAREASSIPKKPLDNPVNMLPRSKLPWLHPRIQ